MTEDRKGGRAEFLDATEILQEDSDTVTVRDSIVDVFPRPADATNAQTLRLVEQSGSLDFWLEEGEDIYSYNDGEEI